MAPSTPRQLWTALEPIHAVTYFAPECRAANRALGLRGFWMGYFAARAAPLGAVGPGVVGALFFGFHPAMVRRALPTAWSHAAPAVVIGARSRAAAAALRRLVPPIDAAAPALVPRLEALVAAASGAGRALFSANRALKLPEDPVAALWQCCTTLREHRGDAHVAVLTAAGLDGCEAHVLFAASEGVPEETLRENRGWSPADWAAARARLATRGLLEGRGPSVAGTALRRLIEDTTDARAARADAGDLAGSLAPLAAAVVDAGAIPFPNPMGLPAPTPE